MQEIVLYRHKEVVSMIPRMKPPWFRRLITLVLAAGLVLSGCTRPDAADAPESGGTAESHPPAAPNVDEWLQQLTVEEKVGQLFWFGLEGEDLSPEAEQLIREGKAGGFILFARQGSDPVQLRRLTEQMQALTFEHGRPYPELLIAVDQEGGLVERWSAPFTSWPGAMAIGATRSEEYAEKVYAAIAEEMTAVGVNLNLAPDADVNNNPRNPVIGIRSFGEDPEMVGRLVAAAVRGTQSQNVAAAAKHFPGHGDTTTDSHLALPTVDQPWERLNQVELVPFRHAVAGGVDVVMSAHITFPAVDPSGLPATLSSAVLTGLLKEEMGFDGVVVTDAVDTMQAITENWGLADALVMAVNAGADALLITDSFGEQEALYQGVLEAVQDGRIAQERLDAAVRRHLELKARRGLLPEKSAAAPAPAEEEAVLAALNSETHRQLAYQVGADALTLVRNQHLPLQLKPEELVVAVGVADSEAVTDTPGVKTALGAGLKAQHENVTEVLLGRHPTPEQAAEVRALAGEAAAIVYAAYNPGDYAEHQSLIRELIKTGKPVVVVGAGEPYDLLALPEIETYIAAYGCRAPNLYGVGALVFGKAQAKGKLPVSIPGLYAVGYGLSLP